jgi:hypothetical protein
VEPDRHRRIAELKNEIGLLSVKRAWARAYLDANTIPDDERARREIRIASLTKEENELEYELLCLSHGKAN